MTEDDRLLLILFAGVAMLAMMDKTQQEEIVIPKGEELLTDWLEEG